MISERVIFSRIDWRRSTSLCLSNFTSSGHREERLVKIHWIKIKASWCCFHLLKRVFKCAFDRFATACYQVELKISAERPGYYVLSQCMQQVSGDISQQFEISKNVEWCSRATVGRTRLIRGSTDWWSKRSSAWPLAFPCHKAGALKHCKDVSFKLVFIPILTYGKKSWVMTERMLFQVQAAAIGFLRRVHVWHIVTKRAAVKFVKPWMPSHFSESWDLSNDGSATWPECLKKHWRVKSFCMATPTGKWPRGRPRTKLFDYISDFAWPRLDVEPVELAHSFLKTVKYFQRAFSLCEPLESWKWAWKWSQPPNTKDV